MTSHSSKPQQPTVPLANKVVASLQLIDPVNISALAEDLNRWHRKQPHARVRIHKGHLQVLIPETSEHQDYFKLHGTYRPKHV